MNTFTFEDFIKIETYKDFDIGFNRRTAKFYIDHHGIPIVSSHSLLEMREGVDNFIKNNENFEPIYICRNLDSCYMERYKVIGINKRGHYIALNKAGDEVTISEINARDIFIVEHDDVVVAYNKIKELNGWLKEKQKQYDLNVKSIMEDTNIESLSSFYQKRLKKA